MIDIKKEHEIAKDIFKYHDMLFQLYEFLGHDIVLKSGAVKRVFYDRSYDDIVFEFQSGRKDYVMDCDTDFSIGAIKLEPGCYIITGGAIKLTRTMQEREHTLNELNKMEQVRNYLISNQAIDADGFVDFLSELS